MRFYLDEDLSQVIAIVARRLGLDVTSAQELGRRGIGDAAQLQYAAEQGRCLVTRDCGDFRRITDNFIERRLLHSGVLCVPKSLPTNQFRQVAEAIVQYDPDHPDGVPAYLVDYVRHMGES